MRQTAFADAKNTANDAALYGPPTLEFAAYGRVPGGKRRNDARQGQIDQDPEFIEFLESLTSPVTKPSGPESETSRAKDEPVTVTPLIQHLRDKKAAKEKASPTKVTKGGRDGPKGDIVKAKSDEKSATSPAKSAAVVIEKKLGRPSKPEKSMKDGGKTPKKDTTVSVAPPSTAPKPLLESAKTVAPVVERRPVTADGAAAARMLQRDLGLQPKAGGAKRGGRAGPEVKKSGAEVTNGGPATKPPAATAAQPVLTNRHASSTMPPESSKENAKPTLAAAPRAESSRRSATAQAPSRPIPKPTPAAPTAQTRPPVTPKAPISLPPSSTATEAFLKHANPSQGVTEPLIEEAMKVFGAIARVEIDKRKGFAYVEFAEPEGLRKAIAASPVKVAQSQVQVLERKDRVSSRSSQAAAGQPRGPVVPAPIDSRVATATNNAGPPAFRGGRGGRGRGGTARGGSAVTSVPGPVGSVATTPLQPQACIPTAGSEGQHQAPGATPVSKQLPSQPAATVQQSSGPDKP